MPEGKDPRCFYYVDNPVISIPLGHLHEGENLFEGNADDQVCHSFGWGQWGWYMMIVRVYFDAEALHSKGQVITPASGANLEENPVLKVKVDGSADDIERIDFLAHYNGYDENGDGIYTDWHHNYHFLYRTLEAGIQDHIGSVVNEPYEIAWDTKWVPDQPMGSIRIAARILNKNGLWFVTNAVEGLSLYREDTSVKMYTTFDIPEDFRTRLNEKKTCKFLIPKETDLKFAGEAAIHIRTWNGGHHDVTLNGWTMHIGGEDHDYAYNVLDFPVAKLRSGLNLFEFVSETHHHGPEILWPGPAVTVRYSKNRAADFD
jgi:hypothetical protein